MSRSNAKNSSAAAANNSAAAASSSSSAPALPATEQTDPILDGATNGHVQVANLAPVSSSGVGANTAPAFDAGNPSNAGPMMSQMQVFSQLQSLTDRIVANIGDRLSQSNGTAQHKRDFEANLSVLKKSSSKQFLRMMYLIQLMHLSKCNGADIVQVLEYYFEWIKAVEAEKGKVREANESLKARLRKRFPSGNSAAAVLDYEEMWEILNQKEIPHCPFPEHWDHEHSLDTCYFNTKAAKNGDLTLSSGSKRSRYYAHHNMQNSQVAVGLQSNGGYYGNPAAASSQAMNPMNSFGMPMGMYSSASQSPGGSMPPWAMQPNPMYQPRTPCGFPIPNGNGMVCQAVDHRMANCPYNPSSRRFHVMGVSGGGSSSSAPAPGGPSMQVSDLFMTVSRGCAGDHVGRMSSGMHVVRDDMDTGDTCARNGVSHVGAVVHVVRGASVGASDGRSHVDVEVHGVTRDSDVTTDDPRVRDVRDVPLGVLCDDVCDGAAMGDVSSKSLSSGEPAACGVVEQPQGLSRSAAGVPVLRQLESSSSRLWPATNQLPTVLGVRADEEMRHEVGVAYTCASRLQEKEVFSEIHDSGVQEMSLQERYAECEHIFQGDSDSSDSECENHGVQKPQSKEQEKFSTVVCDPVLNTVAESHTLVASAAEMNKSDRDEMKGMPHSVRFSKSLSRLMKMNFPGRGGKKVWSDERLFSLTCDRCSTRGHTVDMCINRQSDEVVMADGSHLWVRALLAKPPFNLEERTQGKPWREVEEIIEEAGAEHNSGNPWLKSDLRRDMLRKNLGYWYVIGANSTVLSWLGYGVQLRFLTTPESYAFRNHSRSWEGFEEFVEGEHKLHVKDKSFEELNRAELRYGSVRVINPIMVAVNKKNKPRLCHDMRWPNGYLPHVEFRMETLQRDLADVVSEGDILLSIDISKAYYSVPLHPATQTYLCWMYNGKMYRPTVLIFGVSPAPHVFTKIMRPWMQLCRSVRVKLMGMIDDYLFSDSPSNAAALARFVVFSLTRLGWQLNEKCQLTPQPRVCILGLIVDATAMTVSAPKDKIVSAHELLERIGALCEKYEYVDVRLFQQLCGKLQSMVLALPGVRPFTRALYVLIAKALDENAERRFKCHPDQYFPQAWDEMWFWRERLRDEPRYNGLPIRVRDASVKMWVDASDIGWGGEVAGSCFHGSLPISEIQNSSARRELVALLLVAKEARHLIENERVHIYMDSHNAICNLISGGGQKENLVGAVKEWFQYCETNHIVASYEWIPREQNEVADRYSKIPTISFPLRDGVEDFVRNWLRDTCLVGGDAATASQNAVRASRIAIFVPDFNVIPLRLESIVMNMSEAILITPHWPSQSWWPTLLKHRKGSVILGRIAVTSTPPRTSTRAQVTAATRWLNRKRNRGTSKTYTSSMNTFKRWLGSRERELEAIDETDVVLYIRHLLEGRDGVASAGTISVAISAMRDHFKYDVQKSIMLNCSMVVEAIKVGKRDGKNPIKKKPLTVEMLQAMHDWYHDAEKRASTTRWYRSDEINWTDQRDLCMMILMTAAFLRESELVQLRADEVKFTKANINGVEREIMEVYVRKAKNDQAGHGHVIRVGDAGESSDTCPVFWSKILSKKPRGAPAWDKHFFHSYEGKALNRSTPCGIVQKWVERINLMNTKLGKPSFGDPKTFGSHSCRIGGVTAAHASGVDMELIRQHGNWKSDVVYEYIQPTVEQQVSVTDFMQGR